MAACESIIVILQRAGQHFEDGDTCDCEAYAASSVQGEGRFEALCKGRSLLEPVDDGRAIDEQQCAIRQAGKI